MILKFKFILFLAKQERKNTHGGEGKSTHKKKKSRTAVRASRSSPWVVCEGGVGYGVRREGPVCWCSPSGATSLLGGWGHGLQA